MAEEEICPTRTGKLLDPPRPAILEPQGRALDPHIARHSCQA